VSGQDALGGDTTPLCGGPVSIPFVTSGADGTAFAVESFAVESLEVESWATATLVAALEHTTSASRPLLMRCNTSPESVIGCYAVAASAVPAAANKSYASMTSSMLTVAAPSLATSTPAAKLAITAASAGVAPAASIVAR
jgi:hypothetical protein